MQHVDGFFNTTSQIILQSYIFRKCGRDGGRIEQRQETGKEIGRKETEREHANQSKTDKFQMNRGGRSEREREMEIYVEHLPNSLSRLVRKKKSWTSVRDIFTPRLSPFFIPVANKQTSVVDVLSDNVSTCTAGCQAYDEARDLVVATA
jgi:hypothetical protein